MSNEIFKWQPQMLEITGNTTFNVVRSDFENGMQQRGLISDRESVGFTFTYKHAVGEASRTSKLTDEIKSFWNARYGAYDNFFLPSWKLEGKMDVPVTAGDSFLILNIGTGATPTPADLGFSQTAGESGNYMYICERFARGFEATTTHEIRRIVSWTHLGSGNWKITPDAVLVNSYSTIAYIQKAYKVNFDMDALPHTMNIPDAVTYELQFKEDLASVYQTSFGF